MADVKWIKIATDIFENEKILFIEDLPKRDTLLVIWFKLLSFAGNQNNGGVFLFNNSTPYTSKMLSTVFKRSEKTVKDALKVFEQYGMIEMIDNVITIPNWNKYQTLDSYEKRKLRDKEYQAKRRAEQKRLIAKKSSDASSDTSSDVAFSEREEEIDKEKECYIESEEIYNNTTHTRKYKNPYGKFNNIFLSDEELSQLKSAYKDYEDRIDRLSSYIASSGKSYDNHYATIIMWADEDKQRSQKQSQRKNAFFNYSGDNELNDFEKAQMQKRMNQ